MLWNFQYIITVLVYRISDDFIKIPINHFYVTQTFKEYINKKASSKGSGFIFWHLVAIGTRQWADRIVCSKSRWVSHFHEFRQLPPSALPTYLASIKRLHYRTGTDSGPAPPLGFPNRGCAPLWNTVSRRGITSDDYIPAVNRLNDAFWPSVIKVIRN